MKGARQALFALPLLFSAAAFRVVDEVFQSSIFLTLAAFRDEVFQSSILKSFDNVLVISAVEVTFVPCCCCCCGTTGSFRF